MAYKVKKTWICDRCGDEMENSGADGGYNLKRAVSIWKVQWHFIALERPEIRLNMCKGCKKALKEFMEGKKDNV